MTERTLRAPVHRCGNWAPSWYEGLCGCSCITAVCRTADDGFHQHEMRIGDDAWSRIVVTEHRHTWLDGQHAVDVWRGKEGGNVDGDLAEIWRAVAGAEGTDTGLPTIPCQQTTVTELTVVSGPHPSSGTVQHCDVGGEALAYEADWWLVAAPDRGWETGHGASCGRHLPTPVNTPKRPFKVRDLLWMPCPPGIRIPGRDTEVLLPDGQSTMRVLGHEDQRWRMWNGSTIELWVTLTGPAAQYRGEEFFERIPGCRSGGHSRHAGSRYLGLDQNTEFTVVRALTHSCGAEPGQPCNLSSGRACNSPSADPVDVADRPHESRRRPHLARSPYTDAVFAAGEVQ